MNDKIFYTEDGFAVKTLYLRSLSKEVRGDHLFDYFSTFGEVHSVQIHTHATNSFGFVTFSQAEDAAKTLKIQFHTIAGHKTSVEIAYNWHLNEPSINDDLPIELTNATGTNLLDLNCDCLGEILSYVSLMDLCSVAETSTCLKTLANESFTRKHKICDIMILRKEKSVTSVDEIRRLFSNFGSVMLGLSFWNDEDEEEIIDLLIRYCSGTLETLDIQHCDISEDQTVGLKKLIEKLHKLSFHEVIIHGDAKSLFSNCELMVEFHISDVSGDMHKIFDNTFPKLKDFLCRDVWLLEVYNLGNFISRHKNLKTLDIHSCNYIPLLLIISDNCKQLETLDISAGDELIFPSEYEKNIQSIATLQNLKELNVSYNMDKYSTKFVNQLSFLKLLENLSFTWTSAESEFVTAITKLKNISSLTFHYCIGDINFNLLGEMHQLRQLTIRHVEKDGKADFNLFYIIKRLINLNTLKMNLMNLKIDKNTYSKIIDIVRKRDGGYQHKLEVRCKEIDEDIFESKYYVDNCHMVELQYDGGD